MAYICHQQVNARLNQWIKITDRNHSCYEGGQINPSTLGAVHKRRLQSRESLFNADKGGWGVLQMQTSSLFGAKHFGFFVIYGGLHRQGG